MALATTTGTTTTFISETGLAFPDNDLNGREVWYADSANAISADNEQTRRFVRSSSESNSRITVTPAWPAEPQVGDRIILANARGYSATIPEIHDKINALLEEVGAEMATETVSTSATFDALSPAVAYPTDWDYLLGAQWQDWNDTWVTIPPGDLFLQEWDGTVSIRNRSARLAHQRSVRLIGAIGEVGLSHDDETVDVDLAWLRHQAAAELRRDTAIRWGDVATALTISQILQAEADKRRPRVGKRFSPIGRRWRLRG